MTLEGRERGVSTVSLWDDSVLWGWGHLLPRGGHVLGDSCLHELLGFTSLPHLNPLLHLPKSKPSPPAPVPTSHLQPILKLPRVLSPPKGHPRPHPAPHPRTEFPSFPAHTATWNHPPSPRDSLRGSSLAGPGVLDWLGATQTAHPSSAWVVTLHSPNGGAGRPLRSPLQLPPTSLFCGWLHLRPRPKYPSVPSSTSHPGHLPHT